MLLAAAVLAGFVLLWRKGIAWAGEFGGIAAFVLALYLALARPIGRWLHLAEENSLTPGDAADRLADILRSQWVDEERRWRVNDPYLPVRCRLRGAPFADVREAFQALPSGRMVIVGPAGAGKTVMATKLAIHLASSSARPPGGPLPVILPAVTWSADERLDEWITRELVSRGRWLADRPRNGAPGSLADALARDLVIPVIDGLDEMPEHLRIGAIEQINAWGSDRPVVLTSRPGEYDNAAAHGREVSRAAQVEIMPLSIEESRNYLLEATGGSPSRWDALFRDLAEGTPLKAALTIPLLLWLVRCVYKDAGSDPGQLADPDRFSDQAAIERHLIERLVPAAYDPPTGVSRFGCTSRQAERWLAFLAAHSGDAESHELRWWRLPLAARMWRPLGLAARGALLFAVAWLLSAWVLRRLGGWRHGAEIRRVLSAGLLGRHLLPAAGYLQGLARRADARSIRTAVDAFFDFIPWNSLATLELWVILGCAVAGLASALSSSVKPVKGFGRPAHIPWVVAWIIFWPAVIAAWTFWLLISFPALAPVHQRARFHAALFHSHAVGLLGAAVFVWALADASSWLTERLDLAGSLSASRVLRLDRRAFLGRVLLKVSIRAIVVWLFLGPVIALAYAAYGISSLLARLILGGRLTASSEFAGARLWLAASRRLPWRVMAFLDDAHAIGVLRQTGAAYQFRHGLLEQQLSARYAGWGRRVARLVVRRAGWLVTFLEDWSFRWRWWWPSASAWRWSEPLWALRFDEAARELGEGVGRPAGPVRREGPGVVQHFRGADGDDGWVMCALWGKRPILVAKPAWDALRQVAVGPAAEPTATLGFPVPESVFLRYPWSERRVVRADDDRIMLRGGSWGPGLLLRDPHVRTWRWEPEPGVRFIPGEKRWLPAGPPAPRLRLRAEATVALARPDLVAAPQALQDVARQIASSDLAGEAAGPWSRRDQGSLACTVPAADAMPAHVIEVLWSVSHDRDSTTLTAAAELRVEDNASPDPGDTERRLSLEELVDYFAAAWHATAGLIPAAVLGNVTGLPLTGPPHVDLIMSAATPADLLFRRESHENLSGSGFKALTAVLLGGRLGALRRGNLSDFIDLSPFRAARRQPRSTEMSARITAPLGISSEDRHEMTRQALAYMITLASGLKRRQELVAADSPWDDIVTTVFSKTADFWL